MKKIYFATLLYFISTSLLSQSTLPTKHDLSSGDFLFTSWSSSSTAGTYPTNMIFHYVSSEQSSAFTTDGNLNFNCSYNLTSRPRFNGQGANGFSFVNTSSSQYDNCSSGTASNRFVGAAIVGLDATGRKDLKVTWTGRTINGQASAREYKIAMQYRVGISGAWVNLATPSEYLYDSILPGTSNLTGASQTFTDVALPSACNNQSSVYVRWVYYNVSGSGVRPILGVDDITIKSDPASSSGPITVDVSVSSTTLSETSEPTVTITATASAAVVGDQTVDFAITGTGITSSDFVGSPSLTGTITILDGQTVGTVTRQIFDDALIEGTESATVTISNPSSGITISTSTASFSIVDNDATTIYSRGNGNSWTDAIWAFTPTGTPSTISALNGASFRFTKDFNLVIQSGDTVNWTQTDSVKNLTVQSGAKLRRNNNNSITTSMTYLRVFGNEVTVNGEIGEVLSSPNFDAIGLDIASPSCQIKGTGTYNIARLRNNTCSGDCEAVIMCDVNLRYPGTCIYTEQNFSNFHVQIDSGVTVNVIGVDGNGDVATDGVNGLSANTRGGTFTVNGTLNIADTLFAQATNNDVSYQCGITINNSGRVNVAHVVYQEIDTSSTNFTIGLFGNGKLNISKVLNLVKGVFYGSTGVVLLSTSMDDCAIIDNFSTGHTGEIDGYITLQRFYSNTNKTNNQHIISSPVYNPAYSQFATLTGADNVFVTPTADCSDTAIAASSNYGNIFEYDESNVSSGQCYVRGWKVRSAGNAVIGKGFSVRRPGTGIISIEGTPNTEPFYTISGLTNSNWSSTSAQGRTFISGYHLLGNPYPASLDLVNPDTTEFANIVKVLDPVTGQFEDISMSGSDLVAPFQGFAVLKVNTGGSADFTIYGGTNRKRTPTTFYKNGDHLKQFAVSVQGANGTDKAYINIISDATTDFDMAYDAYKLYGDIKLPALYTAFGNKLYSTNTFGGVSQTSVVPLNFEPNANGNFTLTFDGADNLPNISKVWFEDTKTGFGMDVTNGGTYHFNAVKNDNRARFKLRFVEAKIISGIINTDEKALKVFASGRTLNVDLGSGNTKGTAAIYNAMGALVYELPLFDSFTQTELENIATGTYFVKVSSPGGSISKKIVITN